MYNYFAPLTANVYYGLTMQPLSKLNQRLAKKPVIKDVCVIASIYYITMPSIDQFKRMWTSQYAFESLTFYQQTMKLYTIIYNRLLKASPCIRAWGFLLCNRRFTVAEWQNTLACNAEGDRFAPHLWQCFRDVFLESIRSLYKR